MSNGGSTDVGEQSGISETPVRCRIGDVVRRGPAIEVHQPVPPEQLAGAVSTAEPEPDARVSVTAPAPPPLYEHVGCLRPGMGLRTRTALARAARTLGQRTPYDDELAAARESLADLSAPMESETEARESVAAAESAAERLRERVATARGRLLARRENDLDPTPAAEALADAITELSEAETREAAARQSLERDRESRRDRRDRHERRFRLEDRVANLERRARASLVDAVREDYVRALEALPDWSAGEDESALEDPSAVDDSFDVGDPTAVKDSFDVEDPIGVEDPFAVDPVPAALAIVRVAETPAPVVLALDRFDSARAAHEWLDVPVLRL